MSDKRDYDVRVEFKRGGFQSMTVDGREDAADAVAEAMKRLRIQQRTAGWYDTVTTVSVVLASHEKYRRDGAEEVPPNATP